MVKHDGRNKVVSFKAAREAAFGDSRKGPEDRRQTEPTPTHRQENAHRNIGGYADVWLKANSEKAALLKENLKLKDNNESLVVSPQEYALYLISLLLYIAILVVWALQLD